MCLVIRKVKYTEDKPLTVYKIVKYSNGKFYTPYQMCEIPSNILNGDELFKAKGDIDDDEELNEGVIHCFQKDISSTVLNIVANMKECLIFKCEIPLFTTYYVGTNYDIAAKEIKFIKQIVEI